MSLINPMRLIFRRRRPAFYPPVSKQFSHAQTGEFAETSRMAEGAPPSDEDIEFMERPEEESQGKEIKRLILTDPKSGEPTVFVNSAKLVTTGNITVHNHGPKRTKRSKPLKPLTKSPDKPSAADLVHLSEKLGTRWKQLGRSLGLDDACLDQLDQDFSQNSAERNYQLLRRWMDREGMLASKAELAGHLAKVSLGKLADYLA